ncbi:hypothetical protein [Dactylosporangium sp. CA-092794]|uniref:hypothetical protein n=1 Tax=Dactylosporangium sp. CA-092794 TaxID=3239929 RepID=UPI003D8C62FC
MHPAHADSGHRDAQTALAHRPTVKYVHISDLVFEVGRQRSMSEQYLPISPETTAGTILGVSPTFVRARGGEYFFMPGLRALQWLAEGSYAQ